MRGVESSGDSLFSYIRLEERIPLDHPLRAIRSLVDEVLDQMSGRFEQLYSTMGRPSIPPEHLLRATLVQAFYSVRVTPQACLWHDANADGADRL